jgi:YVTN family beta-propeller protein
MASHRLAALVTIGILALVVPAAADTPPGRIGPSLSMTGNGRLLRPAGRMTTLGNFPTGSALTPDGRFVWVVDSGHGADDVKIVSLDTGAVVQTLALPGGYGGVAIARDGRSAYVSGEPKSDANPPPPGGPTKGDAGDVVHVYSVDPASGHADERDPIALPSTSGGSGQLNSLPPVSLGWPEGLAVTPDGRKVVVALNQADQVAIVDVASRSAQLVKVGRYPFGVAIAPDGRNAYVSNELDGTLSVVDIGAAKQVGTIAVGGPGGDLEAHPEGMAIDPAHGLLYVAVANRDVIAQVDLAAGTVRRLISVARAEAPGVQPVAVAVSSDGSRAFAADEGEDALAVVRTGIAPAATARHRRSARARRAVAAAGLLGRIPTAAFPTSVQVTDSGRLVWVAAKGLGAGPNPDFVFDGAKSPSGNVQTPYGAYVPDKLIGYAGVLRVPGAKALAGFTRRADAQALPQDATGGPPAGSPLVPNGPIKHVFYIVRENRTYDQIFGSAPGGDGDPSLELFDDNGVTGPTGGVTPNAHALARRFGLIDHFYADSEVSVDGHLITSGGVAIDYAQRALHANYSGRGRAFDFGVFPITFGPRDFIFDQAARQGVSFRNYGEQGAGTTPLSNDGRSTYGSVMASTDAAYPGNIQIGCLHAPAAPVNCTSDSDPLGPAGTPSIGGDSRVALFTADLRAQLAAGTVPTFNYLILPNDHTNGTTPQDLTPQALIADNDLALGQVVDVISHSAIWSQSAIIVVEDDSQDGADHVDAHRMPAFVISPWTRGGVVHTRYDQYSALRTAEILAGLEPLSLNDALAEPMYDAFRNDGAPDLTPYNAITPAQSLLATNGSLAPDASLSAALPFGQMDLVPQEVSDRILWHSVHGQASTPPPSGPGGSELEHARAVGVLRVLARGGDATAWLERHSGDGDG